jgi:hypothetical protein
MSASDLESAIYADNIHTLTHKHTLKPISHQPEEAQVIRMRRRAGNC